MIAAEKRLNEVEIIVDGLTTVMHGKEMRKRESIKISDNYPQTDETLWLFSQISLFHLVAGHLPKKIKANFSLAKITIELLGQMYEFDSLPAPIISTPPHSKEPFYSLGKLRDNKVAVAYSGGKDSMYHMHKAQKEYGSKNVLAVHIGGLNRATSSGERAYAISQAEEFGFKNFKLIELEKSSGESGKNILRSGHIFMPTLIVPLALEFGAHKVVVESPGSAKYFSNSTSRLKWFNKNFLKASGFPVAISWYERPPGGVVKHVVQNRPEWIKYVHNCFTPPNYKIGIYFSWLKRTPTFPPMNPSQCGSCVKCRLTRLGWLLYGPHKSSQEDAIFFLKDTMKWARSKWLTHKDIMRGSLLYYLDEACRHYKIENTFKPNV